MNKFRSTDFVLFSCADIVGNDPTVQPYMVSYAAPRYEQGQKIAQQHRVYCKTCHFAFCEAIHAVVTQRNHDNLCGGCVRSDLDAYIEAPVIAAPDAEQQLLYFVEALQDISSGKSNQGNTGTEIVVS